MSLSKEFLAEKASQNPLFRQVKAIFDKDPLDTRHYTQSFDQRYLAYGNYKDLRIYDLEENKLIYKERHENYMDKEVFCDFEIGFEDQDFSFLSDQNSLLHCSCNEGALNRYDLSDGNIEKIKLMDAYQCSELTLSPNPQNAAFESGGTIFLLNTKTNVIKYFGNLVTSVDHLEFSDDGLLLAAGDIRNHYAKVYHIPTGKELLVGGSCRITDFDFYGKYLVAIAQGGMCEDEGAGLLEIYKIDIIKDFPLKYKIKKVFDNYRENTFGALFIDEHHIEVMIDKKDLNQATYTDKVILDF